MDSAWWRTQTWFSVRSRRHNNEVEMSVLPRPHVSSCRLCCQSDCVSVRHSERELLPNMFTLNIQLPVAWERERFQFHASVHPNLRDSVWTPQSLTNPSMRHFPLFFYDCLHFCFYSHPLISPTPHLTPPLPYSPSSCSSPAFYIEVKLAHWLIILK